MGIGLIGIRQVKVPVSDLQRSSSWYRELFELELMREFVEDGVLRGATLVDRGTGWLIGLRDREVVGRSDLAGFDLFSLGVASPEALQRLAERCDRLGVAHGDLLDRGPDGIQLDIPDPDGTVIRCLSPFDDQGPAFAGVEFHADGTMTFYAEPRLG